MFKNLLYSMFAVCLFASGAVGAWYFMEFMQKQQAAEEAAGENVIGATPIPASRPTEDDLPLASSDASDGLELPVPVHSKATSADEIFRWQQQTAVSANDIERRRQLLKQEENRMRTAHKDFTARQSELEGQYQQVQEVLGRAEQMLTQIQKKSEELKAEKEAFDKQRAETEKSTQGADVEREANIKSMAQLVQGMDPSAAANSLKELVLDGKMDLALKTLKQIEPRNAAKILGSIDDQKVLTDLLASFPDSMADSAKRR